MHRVFFDTNAGSQDKGYYLWFPQSKADIESIGPDLREGLHVMIYSPGELELEAFLEYDREFQCWAAIPIG